MKKIDEVELNGEKIYLRKSFMGYKVIYPIKIDGKINWKNFIAGGNWWNLLIIAGTVILILGCVSEYVNAARIANECLSHLNGVPINLW